MNLCRRRQAGPPSSSTALAARRHMRHARAMMSEPSLSRWAVRRADTGRGLVQFLLGARPIRAALARRRPGQVDGRTVEEATAALLALDDVMGRTDLANTPVALARARFEEQVRMVEGPAPPGVMVRDVRFQGPASELRARTYVPHGLEREPSGAVVFFHGGGWVTLSVESHDAFCRRLALGARCRVVSIDYRLAPETRFPGAVLDAVAGTRWVLREAESLCIDPTRVAVMGDSAGGNLTAVVARHVREDARRPALQVLIYPAMDATFSSASHRALASGWLLTRANMDWYLHHYTQGKVDPKHPDLSPLHAPDVNGVAPAIVVTAGLDPLRDEGEAYANKLRAAGVSTTHVEHRGLVHGFASMTAALPAAMAACMDLNARVREALR